MLLELVERGPDHWLGAVGSLLILYWLGDVNPDTCRALPGVIEQFVQRTGRDHLAVVTQTLGQRWRPPSPATRRALADLARTATSSCDRVAVVSEASGFLAATISSVVLAIRTMARTGSGHRHFASLEEGLDWVTAELPEFHDGRIARADVLAELRQQRAELSASSDAQRGA